MPSEDTFFRVKTGLRVGSDTVYADVLNQTVSVGKTTGEYLLIDYSLWEPHKYLKSLQDVKNSNKNPWNCW